MVLTPDAHRNTLGIATRSSTPPHSDADVVADAQWLIQIHTESPDTHTHTLCTLLHSLRSKLGHGQLHTHTEPHNLYHSNVNTQAHTGLLSHTGGARHIHLTLLDTQPLRNKHLLETHTQFETVPQNYKMAKILTPSPYTPGVLPAAYHSAHIDTGRQTFLI